MTEVTDEQFVWDEDKLTHVPTGAHFNKRSDFINYGVAGNTLDDGTCYEREDVLRVAHSLVVAAKKQQT